MGTKLATLLAALALTGALSASARHNPAHTFYRTVDELCGKMVDGADAAIKASNLGLPESLSRGVLRSAVGAYTALLDAVEQPSGLQGSIDSAFRPYINELAGRAHSPHDYDFPQGTMCPWVINGCVTIVSDILTRYTIESHTAESSIARAVESWNNFNRNCPQPYTDGACYQNTDNAIYLSLSRSCHRDIDYFPYPRTSAPDH